MNARLVLIVSLAASCRPATEPNEFRRAPLPESPAPTISAPSTTAASDAPPNTVSAADSAARFEATRLDPRTDPYTEHPIPSGTRLNLRGAYAGASDRPARWLTQDARGVTVFDAATQKSLGKIDNADAPDDVSENVGLLPGWQGPKGKAKPAVLRFEDGKIVIPTAKLPSGNAVQVVRVLVSPKASDIVIVGKSSDNSLHFAPWRDTNKSDIVLLPALATSTHAEWNPEAKAWELFESEFSSSTGNCNRARLRREGAECVLPAGQPTSRSPLSMGGDWFATDEVVENAKTHQRFTPQTIGGHRVLVSRLDSPPRALYASQDRDTDQRTFELIGPKGSYGTWSGSFTDRNSFNAPLYPKDQPVVAERGLKGLDSPLSTFAIDLIAAKIYETPPLDMVFVIGKGDRHFLAVRRGATDDELFVVDLRESASLRSIAKLPSCPGIYWPDGNRDGWLGASCMIEPDPNRVSYIQQWAVLVDTNTKRYFRTKLTPFDFRAQNRFVFGTGKRRGAERIIQSGTLTLVDLSP